ncbi:hypothetical protein CPB83DRAFT_863409 [Crepidotus variabilis]|uniref:UBA domain-containing protein n=1 Tax=Crepidotus variabilis TaxID=179855 RepID=A0A9P6JJU1_9AGAR|nr:hypothetical protein CPB83DRAFT_863409 [Crepidotus variabilis]
MVKGVSRSTASTSATGASSTPQQLPTMQTGQNVHDPLTQLNSHLGFGAMAGLNPFGEMGLNPNDPNMMQGMLNSPQFLQQMSSMMSNPAIIEQIIAMNPQMADMAPSMRAAFQDENFRRMVSNPENLQQMLRMSAMMRDSGMSGMGGMGGFGGAGAGGMPFGNPAASFPAPGNPNPSAPTPSTTTPATGAGGGAASSPPFNLFAGLGGAPPAPGAGTGAEGSTPGAAATPGANPLGMGFNPALMQQMLGLGAFGGQGAGGLGSYGAGAPTTPAAPADTRPPEERFQVQLQQLQDMGFTNATQNVRALLATAGNVQGAIDYIFGGGGMGP